MKQILINNILSMYSYLYTDGMHPLTAKELNDKTISFLFNEQDACIEQLKNML